MEAKLYLVRDEDTTLWLVHSENKPKKRLDMHDWNNKSADSMLILCDNYPEVKWEDEEPTEVEIVIKK